MSKTTEQIKEELVQLPRKIRAELAYFLLESLGPPCDDSQEDFDAMLARRIRAIEDGTVTPIPAHVVHEELRKELS